MVLSGQHSVEAMRRRAEDYARDNRSVPEVFEKVCAVVLGPDTPLDVRQIVSGDAQNAQSLVRPLTIGEFAQLLLKEQSLNPQTTEDAAKKRLYRAYRKSGWERRVTPVYPCSSSPPMHCSDTRPPSLEHPSSL